MCPGGLSAYLSACKLVGIRVVLPGIPMTTADRRLSSRATFLAALLFALPSPSTASERKLELRLAFTSVPSSGSAGQTLERVVVAVVDGAGQVQSGSSALIQLDTEASAGLSGTLSVEAKAGRATFGDLRIARAGRVRLRASSPGLAAVSSGPLVLAAGPCARVVAVRGDGQTGKVGADITYL